MGENTSKIYIKIQEQAWAAIWHQGLGELRKRQKNGSGGWGGGEEGGVGRGRKGYWGIGSLFGASLKAIGAPRAKMWEICRGWPIVS